MLLLENAFADLSPVNVKLDPFMPRDNSEWMFSKDIVSSFPLLFLSLASNFSQLS